MYIKAAPERPIDIFYMSKVVVETMSEEKMLTMLNDKYTLMIKIRLVFLIGDRATFVTPWGLETQRTETNRRYPLNNRKPMSQHPLRKNLSAISQSAQA